MFSFLMVGGVLATLAVAMALTYSKYGMLRPEDNESANRN